MPRTLGEKGFKSENLEQIVGWVKQPEKELRELAKISVQ
jgi:hypothetical protein